MEPERPGSAAPPLCAPRPASEPAGSVPLPFFLQRDSPVSWDFWSSLLAAKSPGSWENSLLWDGSSLVFASSSQGQPGMPEGVGALSPQPLLNLSEFPLAVIWDRLSLDASVNAAPDFDLPLGTAAGLDPSAPWLMSGTNPELADLLCSTLGSYPDGLPVISLRKAMWQQHGVNLEQYSQQQGFLNTLDYLTTLDEVRLQGLERGDSCLVKLHTGSAPRPPPLDPAGFPSPELWLGPPTSPTPTTASDLALPPMAAACVDPTGVPPVSTTKPDLGEIQAHVSRILSRHPKGRSVKQLVKALLKEHGVDLLEISQDRGYQGVVSFLQGVPGIELWNPEKGQKCCAVSSIFKKDVTDPLPLLQSTLGSYPHGLRVLRLKKVMWQQHGVNLEEFSQKQGYLNTLDYLTRLRGIMLQGLERKEKCLVKLHTGVALVAPAPPPPPVPAPPSAWPTSSPLPAAPTNSSQTGTEALPGAMGEPLGLAEVAAWAEEVLGRFPLGLKVGKLKEVLRRERGLNLEALSRQWGSGDALGLLQALPHLQLQDPGRGNACLARLDLAAALHPPESPPLSAGQDSAPPVPAAPLPPAEPQGMAEPDGMVSMIRDLLALYPFGLHVKNLKKLLKERHGASLEDWRKAKGYLNAVSFLRDLPGLVLRDPQKNNKCLVQLQRDFPHPHAASCPGGAAADMSLAPEGSESRDAGGRDLEPAAAPERGVSEVLMLVMRLLSTYKSGLRLLKIQEFLLERQGLDLEAFVRSQGYEDTLGFLQDHLPALEFRRPAKGEKCIVQLGTGQAGGSGPLCPIRAFPQPGSKRWLLQMDAPKRSAPPASGCLNPRLPSATTNRPLLPCLPSGRVPFRAPTVLGTLGKSPGANPCLPAWVQSPPQRVDEGTPECGARPASAPLVQRAEEGTPECGASPASTPLVQRAEEGTPECGTRPASVPLVQRAEEGTPECGARPASVPLVQRAEEETPECGTSTPLVWRAKGVPKCGAPQGNAPQRPSIDSRDAPTPQPSEDLTELKWKVGQILARHPGGMSLFQFRAAYSAAHQHPLPLGHTASTKQRLAQMPDVVRIQGFGVQALLLPVTPNGPPGGEAGLDPWIPQEDAALVGDATSEPPPSQAAPSPTPAVPVRGRVPHATAKPCPPLAHFPPVPPAPILAGDPDTPAEPPPALTAPLPLPAIHDLTGDPDIPSELPLVPTAPAPAGDPQFPTRLPPTFMAPQQGPGPKSPQPQEVASPQATQELPSVRPSAPVVLSASGLGRSSWVWQGAGSPLAMDDPDAAARPVIYPPPGDIPPAPAVGPAPPSLPLVPLAPPQPKQVQMVSPFQGHLDTRALSQTQPTPAAVGSPVDPIPAAPPSGQDLSPATPRSDPRPPPAASGFVTPKQRRAGEALDSPVTPLQRCRLAQPVSAERIKLDPWAMIPPPRSPPARPRRTDTCRLL